MLVAGERKKGGRVIDRVERNGEQRQSREKETERESERDRD